MDRVLEPGDSIGDYEVVLRLKAGGMATLYLGRRHGAAGFSRPVAIKIIHPHLAEDPQFVSMFIDEAKLCARIDHPNVVRVDELAEYQDTYYQVMEYIHGCALSQFLQSLGRTERRPSPELAVALTARVASGLHEAHELRDDRGNPFGVVHRDVTPDNVLLGYRGEVKLIDFGIAKAAYRHQTTQASALKGKVAYMAPEQAKGHRVDRRTDIYALGILLWEQLAMRGLFRSRRGEGQIELLERVRNPDPQPPSGYAPDVSRQLDNAVLAALAPDPSRRPESAYAFRQMLLEAVPQATRVDDSQIATLVRNVMADKIEQDQQVLPSALFRSVPTEEPGATEVLSGLLRSQSQRPPPRPEKTAPAAGRPSARASGPTPLEEDETVLQSDGGEDSLPSGEHAEDAAPGPTRSAPQVGGPGSGQPATLLQPVEAGSPPATPYPPSPAQHAVQGAPPAAPEEAASGGLPSALKWTMAGIGALFAGAAMGLVGMQLTGPGKQVDGSDASWSSRPTAAGPRPDAGSVGNEGGRGDADARASGRGVGSDGGQDAAALAEKSEGEDREQVADRGQETQRELRRERERRRRHEARERARRRESARRSSQKGPDRGSESADRGSRSPDEGSESADRGSDGSEEGSQTGDGQSGGGQKIVDDLEF